MVEVLLSPAFVSAAWVLLPGLAMLALLAVGAAVARRELKALVQVTPGPLEDPLLVVIPARNEEARLGPTLDALLADPAPHLKVVVLDDASTDGTRALLEARAVRDPRLAVIDGAGRPREEGFGKPLALDFAVRAAGAPAGPVLFLDADVVLAPGALGGLLSAFRTSGAAALSGAPRLECGSLVEAMLVPAFVSAIAARFPPSKVHDARAPQAFLNGQVILVDARALAEVGGWRSVKDHVLEDVAIGRRLKERGHALRLADLRRVASTRMYASWPEIREGFGKNAVEARGGALATATFGVLSAALAWAPGASVAAASVAVLGAPSPAGDDVEPGALALLAAALAVAAGVVTLQALLRRWADVPAWPAVLNPLAYVAVALVYIEAALRAVRGGTVRWRGREYRAPRP